jgi:rare lipoprotein A
MKKLCMAFGLCLLLTACGGTKNAGDPPGMVNHKAQNPYVKVGKPYSVFGRTYTPEHNPEYTEEGLASWYGPGFHGKKTANGEVFDKYHYTAAHRTLPMPSMVRVTHLGNGKSIIARVNDRGPFSGGRIIDLSKKSAEGIGMLGEGIAKVRVEYLPEESKKFAEVLVATGKQPNEIDVDREVLEPVRLARENNITGPDTRVIDVASSDLPPASLPASNKKTVWDKVNPIAKAHAAEPVKKPVSDIQETQVIVEEKPVTQPIKPVATSSPYDALNESKSTASEVYYVRLGAFSNQQNIEKIKQQFKGEAAVKIEPISRDSGTLYRVSLGPINSQYKADSVLEKAHQSGMPDAKLVMQ